MSGSLVSVELRPAHGWRAPLVAVVVGAGVTGVAIVLALAGTHRTTQRAFEARAQEARTAVERRVATYSEALFGFRSAFMSGPPLDRATFYRQISLLDLGSRLPGVRAFAFGVLVRGVKRASFEATVRRDDSIRPGGYPDFRIHPSRSGDAIVIDYIEPYASNEQALGFDFLTDPPRRAAATEARDVGDIVATSPIELVQGGRGFIMYLALYQRDAIPETAPARRRAFYGVVTVAFRSDEMLESVFGRDAPIRAEIYDVGRSVDLEEQPPTHANLLYGSGDLARGKRLRSPFFALNVNVADRRWRMYATATPAFREGSGLALPIGTGIVGIALTVLVAALIASFGRAQRTAVALADKMTADIRTREHQLQVANQLLRESDRQRTAFLGTISHELRTPLTAIVGFTDLLKGNIVVPDDRRKDFLGRIARNAAALGTLIDELLDYSRLERDAYPIADEQIDLSELAPRVVDQLSVVLTTHPVRLDVAPGVLVRGDQGALTRVMTNLLANASKFAPPDTTITVTIRDGANPEIVIDDEGPGIPIGERERIFEPFFRGRNKESAPPGTGIGLAVVRTLVVRMGGSIRAEVSPAGGARMVVRLRAAERADQARADGL